MAKLKNVYQDKGVRAANEKLASLKNKEKGITAEIERLKTSSSDDPVCDAAKALLKSDSLDPMENLSERRDTLNELHEGLRIIKKAIKLQEQVVSSEMQKASTKICDSVKPQAVEITAKTVAAVKQLLEALREEQSFYDELYDELRAASVNSAMRPAHWTQWWNGARLKGELDYPDNLLNGYLKWTADHWKIK